MNIRDLLSALFWLAISIFICVEAIQTSLGTFKYPGPGFLPFWSGVVLGTLAIVLTVKSILEKKRGKRIKDLWKGMEWNKVILVLLSLFIYAVFLTRLGYLITTFGFMVLLFGLRKSKQWIRWLSALITALATYIIFYVWLEVQLPKGIFGF